MKNYRPNFEADVELVCSACTDRVVAVMRMRVTESLRPDDRTRFKLLCSYGSRHSLEIHEDEVGKVKYFPWIIFDHANEQLPLICEPILR